MTTTKGSLKAYSSSENGVREFCAGCGTGLFYRNAKMLPGIVDIQTGTLDNPDQLPARCNIQTAERLSWLVGADDLPSFERYPPHE